MVVRKIQIVHFMRMGSSMRNPRVRPEARMRGGVAATLATLRSLLEFMVVVGEAAASSGRVGF